MLPCGKVEYLKAAAEETTAAAVEGEGP